MKSDKTLQPLLAVVIPVYNGEKYISLMIDSIICQTYTNWKLIIVDDGSTDTTLEIVRNYTQMDNRISYYHRDRMPKGAQTCRNIGLEKSVGAKYVAFFDADDIVAPYCFSQRVKYMEENTHLDFSIFPAKTFSNNIENNLGTYYGLKIFNENDLVTFFTSATPFVVWNNIYKRDSLIIKHINWDENILSLQDTDFNIQNILNGMVYEYAKGVRIDYYYRVLQSGTICKQIKSVKHQPSHLYLLNKILNSLNDHQKHEFQNALSSYILRYTKRFALFKCDSLFLELLNNSYIKNQLWFKHRLILFYKMKHSFYNIKFEYLLFPINSYYVRKKRNKRLGLFQIIKDNEDYNVINLSCLQ